MSDVEQRVAAVEARLESAFALDARLKTIEGDVRKLKGGSSVRDWLQTLGPYVGGLVVLLVGFWIKDSVTLALEREKLNLAYAQQMPALIKTFDESESQQAADRNAVALAMYGRYAISPLLDRLELGGDVMPIAAVRGLRIIGFQDGAEACPTFRRVINDRTRRFKWQTHKTLIRVIGESECADARADLESYRAALAQLGSDPKQMEAFAQRYVTTDGFDMESIAALMSEIDSALAIIRQVKT
jgi:hypothetical protein